MADILIKPLTKLDEMHAVVELQRTYWGDDSEAAIPAHMLFSLATHGGHVLAAYDGDALIGVLIGFIGTNQEDKRRPAMANLQIVSKRMVVLPAYRGQGIGYRLKLAQRDMAITQGIRLVEWTFDPLLALNAHLNIRKLGVVCPKYLENYYGTTPNSGGLVTLGSSDRLLAEWWITNRRVEERLFGSRTELALAQYFDAESPIVNPSTVTADGLAVPADMPELVAPPNSLLLVEIPLNYMDMVDNTPQLAIHWREHARMVFKRLFAYGYIVTDFVREQYEGRQRAFYVMSYNGPQLDVSSLN